MDENDYAGFITDFSEEMLTAFPEANLSTCASCAGCQRELCFRDELELTTTQEYAVYRSAVLIPRGCM